jgi:uncharacterized protein YkuJ
MINDVQGSSFMERVSEVFNFSERNTQFILSLSLFTQYIYYRKTFYEKKKMYEWDTVDLIYFLLRREGTLK